MACCFAGCSIVGVSTGTSGVAVAAYIDRDRYTRDLTGETFDFRNHKTDEPVLARGFELPPGSPAWDKQRLWDAVDKAEIATKHLVRTGEVRLRAGAQLAKHYVFALPKDAQITDAQRIEMARQHIQEQFTDNGLACQWAIHMQAGNPHLHVLVTTRRVGPDGFDKHKATDLNPDFARKNGKAFVSVQDQISEKWEAFQNRYFEERELALRVDPRGVVFQLHEGKARHIEASWKTAENEARLEDARQTALVEPETILEKLTARQCLFTERELHAVLKKAGVEDMAEREAAKQRVLSCPECVKLYDGEGQETGLYTSTHVQAEERAILELTDRKMREAGGQASEHARRQALSRKTLDPEQREAFDVMTAANRLCVIQGRAGAGKSYTMGAARDAFEADGWRVVGLAPTNTVSRDMHTDGFQEASTVHAELLRQEKARSRVKAWDRKTVVFVDEAAMLDNRTMHRLLQQADVSGAKVVMIGDDAQLASIQRGGMYTEIRQKTDHALISLVRRQKQDWMRQASMDLADGKIKEAMTAYREHDCIKASKEPIEALLQDWKRDVARNPDVNRFIYAGINTEVNRINDACSKIMRDMGKVRDGITYACEKGEKKFQQTIGVGDRVQFNATAKNIDKNLINGNFGTVGKQSKDQIEVRLDSGVTVSFDPREYKGFALGYAGTVYKGQGKTQTDVYALHGSTWNNRTSYVGATRHKGDFTLYVDSEKVKSFEQLTRSMSRSQERASTLGYLDERQANQVKGRGRDRDGPALTSPGRSQADVPSLDAPKPEIDPERLRAAREARERQGRLTNLEKAREHIQAKARELREKITTRDKHKTAMEQMQPGSLDYRAAVKKLARLEAKEQGADLVLRKSCKELAEELGKQGVKAEVAKVFGLEKAGVVMQRCGLEKAIKHQIKGMDFSR